MRQFLSFPFYVCLLLVSACSSEVEVREYVEWVQLADQPAPLPDAEQGMSGALPENHPTLMEGGGMQGRESEVASAPEVTDVVWELPEGWQEKPGSGMRMAEFIPDPSKPDMVVTLIAMSGNAGSLEANVNRWRRQVNLPPVRDPGLQHRDGKEHYEYLRLIGESEAQKNPQTIVGAIFPQQGRTLFLKFMGPTEDVARLEEAFTALADSLDQVENRP